MIQHFHNEIDNWLRYFYLIFFQIQQIRLNSHQPVRIQRYVFFLKMRNSLKSYFIILAKELDNDSYRYYR